MAATPTKRLLDLLFMVMLVGSVALVFWHESSTDSARRTVLAWVDAGLCLVFIGEWVWRAQGSNNRAKWALRHSWELLGMVPIFVPLPAYFRVLRLVRLVRIVRVFGRLGHKVGVWERIAKESQLRTIGAAAGSVTLLGALAFWSLERQDNGKITSFWDALWWAMETVTTVGYGDITPVTASGRVVASLLMIAGIGTIGLLASSVASVLVVRKKDEATAQGTEGVAGELAMLVELRKQGQLTDEEFQQAKKRVLQ